MLTSIQFIWWECGIGAHINKAYSDVEKEIEGEIIHVIEAKRKLGRNVIGQIEVGKYLVESDFEPA